MKAMIISVGGTIEPIITSLIEHKPEYVCFFASERSVENIGDIKRRLQDKSYEIKENYNVICDDADDLVHCYEKVFICIKKLEEKNIDPKDVVVDYTGGTKTMTSAVVLATIGHGYNFSYVGGKKRTKDGLGLVITGTEVVKTGISPWQIFAVEEKIKISLFVSSFQYEAAISIMQKTMKNLNDKEKEIWRGISEILEGFLAWDNFDHKTAVKKFSSGISCLKICSKFGIDKPIKDFLLKSKENFETLKEIKEKSKIFEKLPVLHPVLIKDIVSNANRRYRQNKYDDAVARLYRAVEMVGQIAFEEITGCQTSEVNSEKLPESIRSEYIKRYCSSDNGKMKIPLFATFRALKEMNHQTGIDYFKNEEMFEKILSARNNSIFAHGLKPIEKKIYEEFLEIIQEKFVQDELIEFSELTW